MTILHLALAADWAHAARTGRYEVSTLGVSLAQQGFVHCSTAAQLPGVAAAFYAGVTEPLLVLHVDEAALAAAGSPVRWEPVPGADEDFPHVYGPIPSTAVTAVVPWEHWPDRSAQGSSSPPVRQ